MIDFIKGKKIYLQMASFAAILLISMAFLQDQKVVLHSPRRHCQFHRWGHRIGYDSGDPGTTSHHHLVQRVLISQAGIYENKI